MEIAILVFMFVLGTLFGSFFNVVGYRLPNNMSIVKPGSHCPNCKHKLSPLELIPILSYIFLGGKCKKCKKKIPIFYPIFELITGLLFAFSYYIFGFSPMLLVSLLFVSTVLIIMISDIKYMIIPDEVLIFSTVFLFIIRLLLFEYSIWNILLDMLIPFVFLLLLKLFGDLIFKKESMGGGDIKLLAMIGAFVGWQVALLTFFIAPFFGIFAGIAAKIKKGSEFIPYGPHLVFAAFMCLLWGEKILKLILPTM